MGFKLLHNKTKQTSILVLLILFLVVVLFFLALWHRNDVEHRVSASEDLFDDFELRIDRENSTLTVYSNVAGMEFDELWDYAWEGNKQVLLWINNSSGFDSVYRMRIRSLEDIITYSTLYALIEDEMAIVYANNRRLIVTELNHKNPNDYMVSYAGDIPSVEIDQHEAGFLESLGEADRIKVINRGLRHLDDILIAPHHRFERVEDGIRIHIRSGIRNIQLLDSYGRERGDFYGVHEFESVKSERINGLSVQEMEANGTWETGVIIGTEGFHDSRAVWTLAETYTLYQRVYYITHIERMLDYLDLGERVF